MSNFELASTEHNNNHNHTCNHNNSFIEVSMYLVFEQIGDTTKK